MGNRAVIAFGKGSNDIGIYLHWNGGPESVMAFLECARRLGVRDYVADPTYSVARLTQIICNYVGGTLSVGVGKLGELDRDNGDNGEYEVGAGWKITDRRFTSDRRMAVEELSGDERRQYEAIVESVLEAMPKDRL